VPRSGRGHKRNPDLVKLNLCSFVSRESDAQQE
jgi:hypothetical protein